MSGNKTAYWGMSVVLLLAGAGIWKGVSNHNRRIIEDREAANAAIGRALNMEQPVLTKYADQFGFLKTSPGGTPSKSQDEFTSLVANTFTPDTGPWGPAERKFFNGQLVTLYQAAHSLAKYWDYGLKPKIDADPDIQISITSPEVKDVIEYAQAIQAADAAIETKMAAVVTTRRQAFERASKGLSLSFAMQNNSDLVLAEAALLGQQEGHAQLVTQAEKSGYAYVYSDVPLPKEAFIDNDCTIAERQGEARGHAGLVTDAEWSGYYFVHGGTPLPSKAFKDKDCIAAEQQGEARGRQTLATEIATELKGASDVVNKYSVDLQIVQQGKALTITNSKIGFTDAITRKVKESFGAEFVSFNDETSLSEQLGTIYDRSLALVASVNEVNKLPSGTVLSPQQNRDRRDVLIAIHKDVMAADSAIHEKIDGMQSARATILAERARQDNKPAEEPPSEPWYKRLSWAVVGDLLWELIKGAATLGLTIEAPQLGGPGPQP